MVKVCVYCHRVLKSKKSIELGAGPVCIRKRQANNNSLIANYSAVVEDGKNIAKTEERLPNDSAIKHEEVKL